MGLGAREASAELTFLTWHGPTGGAPHQQRFLRDFHAFIMPRSSGGKMVNFDQLSLRRATLLE